MKKVIAAFLSILMIVPYAAAAEVGRISYVDGRVDVLKAGSALAVPVRAGESISTGDSIRTKSNSRAEVVFNDKSVLRLAQNSRAEVKQYDLDKNNRRLTATIKLDRGKARTIIAKMPDAAEFNILTPNTEGKVRGSDIFTFYQAGSSGILVADGKMELVNTAHPDESILIPAGNSAFVSMENSPAGPRPFMAMERKMYEQDTYVPSVTLKKKEESTIKGVFVKISGSVKITPKGQSLSRTALLNDIISEGDFIETGDNGLVEIKFDNGCGISLKAGTKIKITRLVIDPKTGVYHNMFESSQGKIRARIENLKGESTFEVKTPTAICGARGTFMYLAVTPAMVKAFFEGGNGYINNLISGAQTDIGMGQNGSADDQGNNSDPAFTSDEERNNWTQGWDADNGTSGYSSPGSNDNTGNLGGNTGGNNNNNTNNTGGGTNNNGNPNVYIPPQPNQPPVPPPAPPAPAMSLTGYFDKPGNGEEGGAFAQYYAYDGLVFDRYSSMTNSYLYGEGDLWNSGSMPFAVFGNYSNPDNLRLWVVDDNLSGSTSDGATFIGVMGGIIDEAARSIKGLMYAFYIRPTTDGYRAGYLRAADLAGGTGDGIFTLTGYMDSYLDELTSISPEMLNDSILISLPGFAGYIGGDISGTIEGYAKKLPECSWNLWKLACGGNYNLEAPPQDGWSAVAGGYEEDESHISYWITHIDGTKWSDGEVKAAISGKGLSYTYNENIANDMLSTSSGDLIGVYSGGSWEGLGAGVTAETALAFGGDTTHEYGVSYALFGGIESVWTGIRDILFIGDYSAQDAPSLELWGFHTLGKTSDNAAIYGMAGGTKLGDILKGILYAIYIRPDPDNEGQYLTGYLKSTDISGNVYPELGDTGMFEANGTIIAEEMGGTAVSPEQLFLYMQNDVVNERTGGIYRDVFAGNIDGDIAGTFSGESIGIDYSLTDQMWSIWRTEANGTYNQEPQVAWHAVFGGSDTDSGDSGYFIGHINGPAWSANEFSGDITGKEIWYSPGHFEVSAIGYMTGETIGTYANGGWEAINFGKTDELPLAFGGEMNGSSGYYDYEEQDVIFDSYISINALFGGTESLWTGTPLVTIIGKFSGGEYKLWATEDDIAGKTSDGAVLSGVMGGIKSDDNSLKGLFYAFYIRQEGECGYVKSADISGNVYPYLGEDGMFEADGTITAIRMGETAVPPADLSFNINSDNVPLLGNVGGDISGTLSLNHANIEDQGWGLWRASLGGSDIGGSLTEGWSAVAGGGDDTYEIFYWLINIDGSASGDNELSATVNGTALSYDSYDPIGRLTTISDGTLLGVHNNYEWEALTAGVYTETPLTFGGVSPKSEFGYYDQELKKETFPSGSLDYLFGGTGSLWNDTAQMTVIGEFSNPDGYKLWDNENPLMGRTSDGAVFYTGEHGYLGGIAGTDAKDSSKGLFYAFYIRNNPDYNPENPESSQYLAGYLKSTNISGNFYPSIGMFKLEGAITHYLDLPTGFSPGQLEANLKKNDNEAYGLISGSAFSGSVASESYRIDGQNWGLWTGSSGGTYDVENVPTTNRMHVGGYARNIETEAIDAYWLGTNSDGIWQDGGISGTLSGTTITTDTLQAFSGDSIGTYGDGNWQALNIGVWTATALEFVSSISSFISESESSFTGLFGSTESPWSGSETPFTIIGSCPVGDGKYHMWGTDLESYNYHNESYTTYDGGAYYGMIGGTFKDTMDGGLIAIYIKDGNAGILSGNFDGTMYPDIEMFGANGTLRAVQKASGIEMPEYLRGSLNELNLEADPQKEGGGGGWEAVFGGTISGGITRENSTVFNISGQDWGIWGATIWGVYTALSAEPDSWRLGLGGKAYFTDTETVASCWLGTLDASIAGDSKLTGDFKGFFFSDAGYGYLKVSAISGDAAGYVDVDAGNGTWQAGAIGEWVEVTDLLQIGQLGFDMSTLQDFVSIPITEVYSNVLNAASNGFINSATMDISLYQNVSANIWAALISGTYSGAGTENWGLTFNNGSDTVNLTNGTWVDGKWTANVGEGSAVGGNTINGQAGGTYGDGNFSGAGTGTWTQAGD